jgi:hypothetical protein
MPNTTDNNNNDIPDHLRLALWCDAWSRATTIARATRNWEKWRRALARLEKAEARYSNLPR